MKDEDKDKKIKKATGEIKSLGVQPSDFEIKASALKNYDGGLRVITSEELNSRVGAIASLPQSGIKGRIGNENDLRMYTGAEIPNLNNNFAIPVYDPTNEVRRVSLGAMAGYNPLSSIASLNLMDEPKQLTEQEITDLIEKKIPRIEVRKKEDIISLIKEVTEATQKQEQDTLDQVTQRGLTLITKNLLDGKVLKWFCVCGEELDAFSGEKDIEKIKKYLVSFKNNLPRSCPRKGEKNWFEIKEDGLVFMAGILFEKVFRPKKD